MHGKNLARKALIGVVNRWRFGPPTAVPPVIRSIPSIRQDFCQQFLLYDELRQKLVRLKNSQGSGRGRVGPADLEAE